MTGHMLQMLFGKKVWTIKDLDDDQLQKAVEICSEKLNRDHRHAII